MFFIKVYDQGLSSKNKLHAAVKTKIKYFDRWPTMTVEEPVKAMNTIIQALNVLHNRCKPLEVVKGYPRDKGTSWYIPDIGVKILFYKIKGEVYE